MRFLACRDIYVYSLIKSNSQQLNPFKQAMDRPTT